MLVFASLLLELALRPAAPVRGRTSSSAPCRPTALNRHVPALGAFGLAIAALLLNPTVAFSQISGTPEEADSFGAAVAHGDFDGDGNDDLAIGVYGEAVGAAGAEGVVQVIYGSPSGLSPSGEQVWYQDSDGIAGLAEPGDLFGWALASGDFNGDGFDDLAIGAIHEDIGAAFNAGAVNVIYGSVAGLTEIGNQVWHQDSPGILGGAESMDNFGDALATGDFDGDGFDDLAIGAPGEDLGSEFSAGTVNVLYGSAAGLSSAGNQGWTQTALEDVPEATDEFGTSLASGDFDNDGFDELAIGVPGEGFTGAFNAGAVNVVYGSSSGLTESRNQIWSQNSSGISGEAENFDNFGFSLASGDFNGDGADDLSIGVPRERLPDAASAGAVHVLYGTIGGLSAEDNQLWTQNSPGLGEVAELNDSFGRAVTAGDFNDDGHDDLVIGTEYEDLGTIFDGGVVTILPGSSIGLVGVGSRSWMQGADGVLDTFEGSDSFGTALVAGDFNGDGNDELAIGVPGEDFEDVVSAGAVNIISAPLSASDPAGQFLYQGATIVVSVDGETTVGSAGHNLLSAAPNPFNSRTTLGFEIPEAGSVRLTVFDARGRQVAVLLDEARAAGLHLVEFDRRNLPSGVYFVRMEANNLVSAERVLLVR